jgi:hypothetical protein
MAVIYMIVVAGLIRPLQALYCSCVVDHRLRQPLKTPVGSVRLGTVWCAERSILLGIRRGK